VKPAMFPPAGKIRQQSLSAVNVCATTSGSLFLAVDTGSDLCAFPRKLLPGRRERKDHTLYGANGTTIPTHGWISEPEPGTAPRIHVAFRGS
jgi:hypothetical protein